MTLELALSLDQTKFVVELPSGHHIDIPANNIGAKYLLNLLIEQRLAENELAKAETKRWSKIGVGTKASPIQYEADKVFQAKKMPKTKAPPKAKLTLADLGL